MSSDDDIFTGTPTSSTAEQGNEIERTKYY